MTSHNIYLSPWSMDVISEYACEYIADHWQEHGCPPARDKIGIIYSHVMKNGYVVQDYQDFLKFHADQTVMVEDEELKLKAIFKSYVFNIIQNHW